jgi:hypothetical protein
MGEYCVAASTDTYSLGGGGRSCCCCFFCGCFCDEGFGEEVIAAVADEMDGRRDDAVVGARGDR